MNRGRGPGRSTDRDAGRSTDRGAGRSVGAVGLVALVVVAALAAVPAGNAAHGYHLTAGTQRSVDGAVVIERAFLLEAGHVVLRADDGGEPGRVLGHAAVGSGPHRAIEVGVDPGAWADLETPAAVWAVIHGDDGDGEFDPDADGPVPSSGGVPGTQFRLGRAGEAPAHVVARGFQPQPVAADWAGELSGPSVVVRRVALPADGHLVLSASVDGERRVVGSRSLSAGVHENVSVRLDGAFVDGREAAFSLRAAVHRDDGDGRFDDADEAATVDGRPVATEFRVRPVDRVETATPSPPPNRTATSNRTAPPLGSPTAASTTTPGFGLAAGAVAALAAAVALTALALARRRGR